MSTKHTKFKRSGTFSFGCFVPKTAGSAMPAGTWDAKCQLVLSDGTRIDIAATLTPPVGPETRHTLLIEKADASAWTLGLAKGDVLFFDASAPPVRLPTSTFVIDVVEEITQP